MRPALDARRASQARAARYTAAADAIAEGYKGKKLLPKSIRTLRSQSRRADAEVRAHMDQHSEPFQIHPWDEPEWASTDLAGENALRDRQKQIVAAAGDLKLKGRDPRKVKVKAKVALVGQFERSRSVGQPTVRWSREAYRNLHLAHQGQEISHDMGLEHFEGALLGSPAERRAASETLKANGIRYRILRGKLSETVSPHVRVTPEGTRKVEGYPNARGRKALAAEMQGDVRRRAFDWLQREAPKAEARQAAATVAAKASVGTSMLRLGILRSTPVRLAVLGAGAALGGLAGYWGARTAQERLGKADGEPDIKPDIEAALNQETGVFQAGSAVEDDLASRIARAFRGWKDDVGERLGQPRGASLHSTMLTDLDRAMRPLDDALQGGADVPAIDPNGLAFSLGVRSPMPERFVQAYRLDRVRELADDQRDSIKAVLLSAAKDGASPDEMARRIKQTVGLTAYQSAQVLSYRKQLETMDKGALGRQLRDQRYDSSITRAITTNKPLTTDQVDRFTDAYHRKFLAYRAMTIARTEGLRAANNGHVAAVDAMLEDQPGMTVVKTWMAKVDSKTRHDHRELHGTSVVGLETLFVCDDGTSIRWPHDPDADVGSVANCRCTLVTRLVPRNQAARLGAAAIEQDAQNVFA